MKYSWFTVVGMIAFAALARGEHLGQENHPWLVRLRALNMTPANNSRAFSALQTNFGADAISLNTKTFPEVDFTYFFNKNIALELVLTYPQEHDVTLAGVGKIGTVKHLPPTLTVQYHFPIENSAFKPYVGAGVNFTRITESNLAVGNTALDVTRDSFGLAYGLGCDYMINDRWSVNIDFKHVDIRTNVKVAATGAILTNLDVNPNLFSIGVGYRF